MFKYGIDKLFVGNLLSLIEKSLQMWKSFEKIELYEGLIFSTERLKSSTICLYLCFLIFFSGVEENSLKSTEIKERS